MKTSWSGVLHVGAYFVVLLLASCDSADKAKNTTDEIPENPERLVDEAGNELVTTLRATVTALPKDEVVIKQFHAHQQDYESVASFVQQNPMYSRFDRTMAPPRYYTIFGLDGLIANLDPPIADLLLSETLPEIIDGNLSSDSDNRSLNFVSYRSGTVIAGTVKGIAYVPNGTPGVLLQSLDGLSNARIATRNGRSHCSYRKIDDKWFVFLCN